MAVEKVRLQKYLSQCGVASRRKAEELIVAGKVRVNGVKAELGEKIIPGRDEVTVHGRKAVPEKKEKYIMLHKPRGFITTMDDEYGRKCVAQLVKDVGVNDNLEGCGVVFFFLDVLDVHWYFFLLILLEQDVIYKITGLYTIPDCPDKINTIFSKNPIELEKILHFCSYFHDSGRKR